VAAIGLLALGAGSAAAATLSVKKGVAVYRAAPGERNEVVVIPVVNEYSETSEPGDMALVEYNNGLTVDLGPGCYPDRNSLHLAFKCHSVNADLRLGDGNDSATVEEPTVPDNKYVMFAKTRMKGEDGDDLLVGGNAPDMLLGQAGNDTIVGMGRSDRMIGGPGDDRISGADNVEGERISCGSGQDTLFTGPADLALPADHATRCDQTTGDFLVSGEQSALG
jgi:Ca2+-binding RTX toxin-like protein